MKILRLCPDGKHKGITGNVMYRKTRKGFKKFLPVVTENGFEVEYLLPDEIREGSEFFMFIREIAELDSESEIDDSLLVGLDVIITVKHIRKGGAVYANIVKIEPCKT